MRWFLYHTRFKVYLNPKTDVFTRERRGSFGHRHIEEDHVKTEAVLSDADTSQRMLTPGAGRGEEGIPPEPLA